MGSLKTSNKFFVTNSIQFNVSGSCSANSSLNFNECPRISTTLKFHLFIELSVINSYLLILPFCQNLTWWQFQVRPKFRFRISIHKIYWLLYSRRISPNKKRPVSKNKVFSVTCATFNYDDSKLLPVYSHLNKYRKEKYEKRERNAKTS